MGKNLIGLKIFLSLVWTKKNQQMFQKAKHCLPGWLSQTLLSSLLPIYLLSSFIGWKHINFWVISLFIKQCNLWAHLLQLFQRYYQSVPVTESDGQILVESTVIMHVWGFWRHKWWQIDELTRWEDKKKEKQQIVRSITSSACRWPWCKIFGHEVSFYFQHYSY